MHAGSRLIWQARALAALAWQMRALAWGAALLLTLATRSAGAADWTLDWRAPAGCPSAAEVEHEITKRSTAPTGNLSVRAVVVSSAGGYRVELELSGAVQGTRSLEAPTCASLARATALIVLLAIDPNAATSLAAQLDDEPEPAAPPPPPLPAETTTPAPTESEEAPARSPEPDARSGWRAVVAGALLAEVAWIPGVAWGAAGWVGLAGPHVSLALAVGGVPSASTELESGLGAHWGLGFAGLRGCVSESWGLEWSACGRLRGAFLSATGFGGAENQSTSAFVALLEPGVTARWEAGYGVGVELGGFVALPLQHHRFVFTDPATSPPTEHTVFELGPGVSLSAAVDLRF